MTISKKLSIIQLILSFSYIFIYIFLIYKINNLKILELYNWNYLSFYFAFIIIIGIIIFTTSIAQIIYQIKEKTSLIYIAAGICSILIFFPFLVIIIIILNIIGISIYSRSKILKFKKII